MARRIRRHDLDLARANNTKTAYQFFVNKGLGKDQAAGIVGNLIQESSVDPNSIQYFRDNSGRAWCLISSERMPDATIIPIRRAVPAQTPEPPRTLDEALAMHLDALYTTARFLCREPALAEDLVQDTALAAFRGWGELRDPAAARPWLLKILHRQFYNARRFESHRPPIHDVELDALLDQVTDHPIIHDPFARDVVMDALLAIPPGFGEVAWLVDALELTLAEVAELLEVPIGTVASRLHRARRMLRERLATLREEMP